MKSIQQWLSLYGESHQNAENQKIHKVCVPLIYWSVVAFLVSLPLPETLIFTSLVNWAVILSIPVLAFYFWLHLKAGLLMLIVTVISVLTSIWIAQATQQLLVISILVFVLAWIGQFIGHKIEGKKPSFFDDLAFLLIGPLWVFKNKINFE